MRLKNMVCIDNSSKSSYDEEFKDALVSNDSSDVMINVWERDSIPSYNIHNISMFCIFDWNLIYNIMLY